MTASDALHVQELNHHDPEVRARIFDFLAPHEAHSLFILGNLSASYPGSHLYAAIDGDSWLGIAGYYERPKALVPFSRDPHVARALARHVVASGADIEFLNGVDYAAEPAYAEMLSLGYRPESDPHKVFFELNAEPPPQPGEELVLAAQPDNVEGIAWLLRYLHTGTFSHAPLSERDRTRAELNPDRYVLKVDNRVVSTANTNGTGIHAFQVLGVATDPDYQRRGYARAVCAALIRRLFAKGASHAVLFTEEDNTPAIRCYEGLGFKRTGRFYIGELTR